MMAELEKLETNLGGVDGHEAPARRDVRHRPAQGAARHPRGAPLGMPVVGLVDTNCDPDDADYVIPGNDDAIRSCSLVVRAIANAIEAGKSKVTVEEMAAARGRAARARGRAARA